MLIISQFFTSPRQNISCKNSLKIAQSVNEARDACQRYQTACYTITKTSSRFLIKRLKEEAINRLTMR